MTSAAKTTKRQKGFTLIEIVMVLAIAGVILGGAMGYMIYSSEDRALRNVSGEIELMAKRARVISVLHQTPYALEFREGVVRLLPFAQAGMQEKRNSRSRFLDDDGSEGADQKRELVLDDGIEVAIRRWNTDQWLSTRKGAIHVWRFDPDGLCEPISTHISFGKSWVEDTFHPLTATSILLEKRSEVR